MGICASSNNQDVFTQHQNEFSLHEKVIKVVTAENSHLDASHRDEEKIRVIKASKILIIGY